MTDAAGIRSGEQVKILSRVQMPRSRFLSLMVSLVIFLGFVWRYSPLQRRVDRSEALTVLASKPMNWSRASGATLSMNTGRVLESFSNPYGYLNLIEADHDGIFNPSTLVLPDAAGKDRLLFASRSAKSLEKIDGDDVRWQHVWA